MTSLASTIAADIQPIRHPSIPAKVGLALALAVLADWLFYGERVGLSLSLFAIAIAGGAVLFNHAALDLRRALTSAATLVAGLAPAVEELNPLSFLILVTAMVIALLLATNPETTELADRARALRNFVLFGPFDSSPRHSRSSTCRRSPAASHFGCCRRRSATVFVALFALANPVIEQWVSLLNPKLILEYVSIPRVLFWTTMLALIWPFIHVRWRSKKMAATVAPELPESREALAPFVPARFLGPSSILRSLILFNLLFAAQSVLDAASISGAMWHCRPT